MAWRGVALLACLLLCAHVGAMHAAGSRGGNTAWNTRLQKRPMAVSSAAEHVFAELESHASAQAEIFNPMEIFDMFTKFLPTEGMLNQILNVPPCLLEQFITLYNKVAARDTCVIRGITIGPSDGLAKLVIEAEFNLVPLSFHTKNVKEFCDHIMTLEEIANVLKAQMDKPDALLKCLPEEYHAVVEQAAHHTRTAVTAAAAKAQELTRFAEVPMPQATIRTSFPPQYSQFHPMTGARRVNRPSASAPHFRFAEDMEDAASTLGNSRRASSNDPFSHASQLLDSMHRSPVTTAGPAQPQEVPMPGLDFVDSWYDALSEDTHADVMLEIREDLRQHRARTAAGEAPSPSQVLQSLFETLDTVLKKAAILMQNVLEAETTCSLLPDIPTDSKIDLSPVLIAQCNSLRNLCQVAAGLAKLIPSVDEMRKEGSASVENSSEEEQDKEKKAPQKPEEHFMLLALGSKAYRASANSMDARERAMAAERVRMGGLFAFLNKLVAKLLSLPERFIRLWPPLVAGQQQDCTLRVRDSFDGPSRTVTLKQEILSQLLAELEIQAEIPLPIQLPAFHISTKNAHDACELVSTIQRALDAGIANAHATIAEARQQTKEVNDMLQNDPVLKDGKTLLADVTDEAKVRGKAELKKQLDAKATQMRQEHEQRAAQQARFAEVNLMTAGVFSTIGDAAGAVADTAKSGAGAVADTAKAGVVGVADAAGDVADKTTKVATDVADKGISVAKDAGNHVVKGVDMVAGHLDQFVNKLGGLAKKLLEMPMSLFAELFGHMERATDKCDALLNMLQEEVDKTADKIQGAVEKEIEAMKPLIDKAKEYGKDAQKMETQAMDINNRAQAIGKAVGGEAEEKIKKLDEVAKQYDEKKDRIKREAERIQRTAGELLAAKGELLKVNRQLDIAIAIPPSPVMPVVTLTLRDIKAICSLAEAARSIGAKAVEQMEKALEDNTKNTTAAEPTAAEKKE